MRVGELRAIFDFDVFSLDALWRESLDDGQHHFVELRRSDVCLAVEINLFCGFQNAENALFGEGRSKDDGEIDEGCHAVSDGRFERVDYLLRLFLHQVPFVHHHNETFVVLLYQLKDVHVLRFHAACRIEHEYANIAVFYGTYRSHHAIELKILAHFILAADACGVD